MPEAIGASATRPCPKATWSSIRWRSSPSARASRSAMLPGSWAVEVEAQRHHAVGPAGGRARLGQRHAAAAQPRGIGRRDARQHVDLAGQQRVHLGVRIRDDAEHQAVEPRQAGPEVVGVAQQHDLVVAAVAVEAEGAGADRAQIGRVGGGIGAGKRCAGRIGASVTSSCRSSAGCGRCRRKVTAERAIGLDRRDGGREAGARARMEAQQDLLEADLHILRGEGLAVMPDARRAAGGRPRRGRRARRSRIPRGRAAACRPRPARPGR